MQMNVILIKVLAAASWRGPRLRTTSVLASAAAPSAAAQHWPPAETSGGATLTYLEINGWLISAAGVTVLVDPVLEGRLDFGIPALFAASKQRPPSPAAIRHRRVHLTRRRWRLAGVCFPSRAPPARSRRSTPSSSLKASTTTPTRALSPAWPSWTRPCRSSHRPRRYLRSSAPSAAASCSASPRPAAG